MVTEQERALARAMDREIGSMLKRGVVFAARIATRIQRAVNRAFRNHTSIVDAIEEELLKASGSLVDTMVVAYLLGLRRTRIQQPALAFQKSPHSEALKFLQTRLNMSPEELTSVAQFYEADAIKVMKAASRDMERALQKTIAKATKDGVHVREGIRRLGETFAKQGYTPGNSYALEGMFRTQTQLAYSAGTYAQEQDPDIQEILWGYKYVTVGDNRVRDSHIGLDGVTLPKDDGWWATNRPPNGPSCRCQVIAIFEERQPVPPPHAVKVDGKSVVQGADPGFRFNPGTVFDPLQKITYEDWLTKNALGQGTMKIKGVLQPQQFWQDKLAAYNKKKLVTPVKTKITVPSIKPTPAPSLVTKDIVTSPNVWKKTESLEAATKQFQNVGNVFGDAGTNLYTTTAAKRMLVEIFNALGDDLARIKTDFPKIGKVIDEGRGVLGGKWMRFDLEDSVHVVNTKNKGAAGIWSSANERMTLATKKRRLLPSSKPTLGDWDIGTDVTTIFNHELGHSLQRSIAQGWDDIWRSQSKGFWEKKVSMYGSASNRELWAESFSAYTHPSYGLKGKRLPKLIEDFMQKNVGAHPNLKVAPEVKKLVGIKPKVVKPPPAPPKKPTIKEFTPQEKFQFDADLNAWEGALSGVEKGAFVDYQATVDTASLVRLVQKGFKVTPNPTFGDPKKILKAMNSAFKSAPQYRGTVYRGMNDLKPDFVKKLAVEGNVLELEAFASASLSEGQALQFGRNNLQNQAGRMWVNFKMKTDVGARLRGFSDELKEVVLPKGAKFKVTNVKAGINDAGINGVTVEMEIVTEGKTALKLTRYELWPRRRSKIA